MNPVQRTQKSPLPSGRGGCECGAKSTVGSTRVITTGPSNFVPLKYSAFKPGWPSGVVSTAVGTGFARRRKFVPGEKVTDAFGNDFLIPSSAVVACDGVPL